MVVEHEGHLYGLLVDAADDIVAALDEPGPLGADPGPGWQRVAHGRVETEAGALPLLDIAALIAGPDELWRPRRLKRMLTLLRYSPTR